MSKYANLNPTKLPVAMIIGATTKWQANGRNTVFAHGETLEDAHLPPAVRWGMGGALALKFAQEGFFTVMTTRKRANAEPLAATIKQNGGQCTILELDVADEKSIAETFTTMRQQAGEPDIVIYNVGYFYGRDLPPEMELLENTPIEIYDQAQLLVGRGPLLVAQQVLPAMRERGSGSIFFSNNPLCLQGRRRRTGESLYFPRVMQRALAQVLADEYSRFGVHAANVIVNGVIDAPGTRELQSVKDHPEIVIDPAAIADTFYQLHQQHPSCWTYELQITPSGSRPIERQGATANQ